MGWHIDSGPNQVHLNRTQKMFDELVKNNALDNPHENKCQDNKLLPASTRAKAAKTATA